MVEKTIPSCKRVCGEHKATQQRYTRLTANSSSSWRAGAVSALHLAPGDGTVLAEPVGRALASGLDEACRLELRS